MQISMLSVRAQYTALHAYVYECVCVCKHMQSADSWP